MEFLHQMEAQGHQLPPLQVSQEEPPTTSSKSEKPKAFGLGTKRGASSPNIPCCSRDEQFRYHLPKMHKDGNIVCLKIFLFQFLDNTSCSMPNIGPTFGASLYTTSQTRPNPPSAINTTTSQVEKLANVQKMSEQKMPGEIKEPEDQPGPSNAASIGLYEELLASSSFGKIHI